MKPKKPCMIWGHVPVTQVPTLRPWTSSRSRAQARWGWGVSADPSHTELRPKSAVPLVQEHPDLILLLSPEPLETSQRAALVITWEKKEKSICSWVFVTSPFINLHLILQHLDYEPVGLKAWTYPVVLHLGAHLQRRHIHPRPQRSLTNSFSIATTKKKRRPGKQENKTWT